MTRPMPNPFIASDTEFVLDVDRFMAALEEPPMFIRDPRPEFLSPAEKRSLFDVVFSRVRA